jgi:uncharacterized membrane protein
MALVWTQELLLILMIFVLALFLIAFVLALLFRMWNRKKDSRMDRIEERLKAMEDRLKK